MAKEYIDREAAKNYLQKALEDTISEASPKGIVRETYELCTKHAISYFKFIPAADVAEVRHGDWKRNGIADICSLCNAYIVVEQGTAELNYCPNCGADMRGGENE